jgi:hypothetical protein
MKTTLAILALVLGGCGPKEERIKTVSYMLVEPVVQCPAGPKSHCWEREQHRFMEDKRFCRHCGLRQEMGWMDVKETKP